MHAGDDAKAVGRGIVDLHGVGRLRGRTHLARFAGAFGPTDDEHSPIGEERRLLTVARNRQRGKLQDYPVDFTSWSGNAYVNSSLQLGKAWAMQLSSWLRFPGMEGISRTKTFGSIDGALQKSWKDKTWVIRLVVNDIFNMQRVRDISRFATVEYTYYRKWESRGVRLAMTWKFGNRQLKNGTEREIGEGSERIKQ